MITMSVFLDLFKIIYTTNHTTLPEHFHVYGIRGLALEWFRNYLTYRTSLVSYKNINAIQRDVTRRVSQGNVLDPLLLIIYTKGLRNALLFS